MINTLISDLVVSPSQYTFRITYLNSKASQKHHNSGQMKSESTQVSCTDIYNLFQFTVHTVVPVVPVTTHQTDPIST